MRPLLTELREKLATLSPSFIHVPQETPYPYISLEPLQNLVGLPWGPRLVLLNIKIWSRYKGTREIMSLARKVEDKLFTFSSHKATLKIIESSLILLGDGQTRTYTFRLKVRLQGNAYE